MKILIEFKVENNNNALDEFLGYMNDIFPGYFTIKKYPKKYKKIVEENI
jgi:hypothetical protein